MEVEFGLLNKNNTTSLKFNLELLKKNYFWAVITS